MEFVTYIGPLFAVLFALHLAIRRHAQIRAHGNKVSWTNTWLTGFASVVITLLAITGLTHRQSYKDIFAITLIKVTAVGVVIGLYYWFGIS